MTAAAKKRERIPVSLAVLAFLCFQFSRVYFIPLIPAGGLECPLASHIHETISPLSHHNGEASDQGSPYCTMRCNQTLDVRGLAPVQPSVLPVQVSPQWPAKTCISLPQDAPSAIENYLPPPFQPPKNLS